MNKKFKLYAIILINLVAWGYVGYKVYGALQGNDELETNPEVHTIKKMDEVTKSENVSLFLNYPDPFLKNGNFSDNNSTRRKNVSRNTSIPKTSKTVINSATISNINAISSATLNIKYLGLLKNNDKGTQTAMLSFNNRMVYAKKNDNIEGCLIIDITNQTVKIKKGKEMIIVNK